ncbi:4'-phosphopantetheinyl transferase family protein [Pasteurellaceae bacterium 22721_9_1]
MATFIAYANIQQSYPTDLVPELFWGNKQRVASSNPRVKQRSECQKLAYFLLHQLCERAQVDTSLLNQVYRTASGRPQFPLTHMDFNISHSDNWVAVILSIDEKPNAVGIDIEFAKKSRNYTALLQHFASQSEQKWFAQQDNPEVAFYRIWCLREAILKSQGVGIVKLTEVEHYPTHQQLYSSHCPQGELLFVDDLPFYLAAFTTEGKSTDIHCFHWRDDTLMPTHLPHALHYAVNPTK